MSSITVPDSGSPVTSAGIEAVYEVLRTQGNAILPADFQRQALGPQHFAKNSGGVIRVRDFIDYAVLGATTSVTGTMTDRSLADIVANWTPMSNYTLNGPLGNGYAVSGRCHLVWFMNFRLKEWVTKPDPEHMAFFAATYAVDSGSETLAPLMPVGLHPQVELIDRTPTTQEQSVSWWGHIDFSAIHDSAWNLDYIKFYAARCQCGAGALPANFSVPHGTVGFFLVKA